VLFKEIKASAMEARVMLNRRNLVTIGAEAMASANTLMLVDSPMTGPKGVKGRNQTPKGRVMLFSWRQKGERKHGSS
jgi:hypothetical protein